MKSKGTDVVEKDTWVDVVDSAWDAVDVAWDVVDDAVEAIDEWVDAVEDIAEEIVEDAEEAVDAVVDAVEDNADDLLNVVNDSIDQAEEAAKVVVEDAAEEIDNVVDAVDAWAQDIVDDAADVAEEGEDNENNADTAVDVPAPVAVAAYQNYSADKVAAAVAAGKKTVLFFHATWCPSCVALDNSIVEDLYLVDSNTAIFKANFDDSSLSAQYGIKEKHTLIALDWSGSEIARSRTLFTAEQLVKWVK